MPIWVLIDTLGAANCDMHAYTAGEVLCGMLYAEVVTVDDQLRPVADLTRLSLVEPDLSLP
jgi:inward rectifier potassium channel